MHWVHSVTLRDPVRFAHRPMLQREESVSVCMASKLSGGPQIQRRGVDIRLIGINALNI
jgi:hypothetical protein